MQASENNSQSLGLETSSPPLFRYECAARTDVGMRRAMNQDAIAIAPTKGAEAKKQRDRFLIVADGMGAHAAGELASKIAIETVPHVFAKSKTIATDALRIAIREANERILAKGSSSPEFEGMGTTCSCLVLSGDLALVGHVGDSRVYRLRQGTLEQLSFDHSLVWELAAASNVTEDKVPAYIPKNVITRSLGPNKKVNVDLEGPYSVQEGDCYLLCSDGLTGVVKDQMIGAIMKTLPPEEAVSTLIDLANLGGGPDNISVAIARAFGENESADTTEEVSIDAKPMPWFAWVLSAFFFLLSCFQIAIQNEWGAFLASAAALGIFCTTFSRKGTTSTRQELDDKTCLSAVGVHGNGPYRNFDCTDLTPAAESLRDLVHELAEVSFVQESEEQQKQEPISREAYREQLQAADELLAKKDLDHAIKAYANLVGLRTHLAKEYRSGIENSDKVL